MIKIEHYKNKRALKNQCKHLEDTLQKEKKYLKEIAEKCKEAYKNGVMDTKVLSDFLVDPNARKGKELKPEHTSCKGFKDTPRSGGEKQICHCMFYFNKDYPKNCTNCNLPRWKNVGTISIEEFEYPSRYDIPGIGGIDLVLNYDNVVYGAEVKPSNSKETISRMVSEILTYSVVDRLLEFKPAIAVFRDSNQYNTIVQLRKKKDADWLEITEHITVFVIDYAKKNNINEFTIKPFD
ncbi:hypothetical protein [Pseudobutyrivibrio sp. LB2011]|uniref:hypothetical protein n=1 Tax=Pseudobutyrivibrio sp. LB2011 TaxID=1408312 RepID=UPI0005D159E3|nr:hypothetical protein [Pseudobutyrivibrio sp. LB2011]